jgi:hypothetical protein
VPFTPAHIVAVLPFRKRCRELFFAALVIGSIVPDMEYFLRFNPASGFSHTVKGIFLFDLPLSLLMLWLWQLYIKQTFISFIPYLKEQPAAEKATYNFTGVLSVIICIIAGTSTHLIWDAFTHGKGYFVVRTDWLQKELFSGVFRMKMCYFLWYFCSITGTIIVMLTFFSRKRRKVDDQKTSPSDFWSKVLFLTLMIAVIRISMGLSHNIPRHLVIIAIGSFLYAFSLIAFTEYFHAKKSDDPA